MQEEEDGRDGSAGAVLVDAWTNGVVDGCLIFFFNSLFMLQTICVSCIIGQFYFGRSHQKFTYVLRRLILLLRASHPVKSDNSHSNHKRLSRHNME